MKSPSVVMPLLRSHHLIREFLSINYRKFVGNRWCNVSDADVAVGGRNPATVHMANIPLVAVLYLSQPQAINNDSY